MKIARIETFLVPPRWLFCRVETDDGLVGWGEPVVEGRAEVVRGAVEVLSELLTGQDPLRIEDHWQVLTKGGFYRGGPVLSSAVAGLDQALWDIAGQAYGAPVHALLGGPVRDTVRVYAWVGGDEPTRLREQITAQVEAGFTAVKMNAAGATSPVTTAAETAAVVARVAAAREVLGPDRDVAVDFHGRFTAASARRVLSELAPLHPLFVEEPVVPEQSRLLPGLVAASPVPLATGERLYSRAEFLPVLTAGVAVAQPDLSHAGGISEVRRIASSRRPSARCSPRTARSARSPSRPASRSPSRHRTSSSRSRAGASTTTRTPTCCRTSSTPSPSGSSTDTRGAATGPVSASPSTRPPYAPPTAPGTPGATRCGGTPTAPSPNGERAAPRIVTDPAHGGRWTSLTAGGREWLWHREAPERADAAPRTRSWTPAGWRSACPPSGAHPTTATPGHGAGTGTGTWNAWTATASRWPAPSGSPVRPPRSTTP
ncbi:hypothetical protein SHKM778_52110 [Streptomyces sp. KM77-8]|uniref:Mandelate racemase/muconate lactonizing enzyme C-terminal domain-containing protein n=1 Tax=Streptomyces haneummycinicus TaxID=3074435 RepID=A0AAT9HN42_9ACTN